MLKIREPRRPFEDWVRVRGGRVTREQIEEFVRENGGGRVLHPRGSSWIVERFADPAERRFLLGYDQRHLFAAQIPAGDTVPEAHESLKPSEVKAAEQRRPGSVIRQGEWFFAPTSREEVLEVRRHIARPGRLPGDGEPHFAEQLVSLPGERDPETGWLRLRFYVRGTVHHRDHRTVCFDSWRRVHLNTAVRRRGQRARGFHWID